MWLLCQYTLRPSMKFQDYARRWQYVSDAGFIRPAVARVTVTFHLSCTDKLILQTKLSLSYHFSCGTALIRCSAGVLLHLLLLGRPSISQMHVYTGSAATAVNRIRVLLSKKPIRDRSMGGDICSVVSHRSDSMTHQQFNQISSLAHFFLALTYLMSEFYVTL